MTTVVRRPHHRYEIRESHWTGAGPRSRTLASFRTLTDEVLAHARSRAQAPFDQDAVIAAAHRVGAPVARDSEADVAAKALLRAIEQARGPKPLLARLVVQALGAEVRHPLPAEVTAAGAWLAADPTERGRTLADLLDLVDALPADRIRRDREPFPRLGPHPAGH